MPPAQRDEAAPDDNCEPDWPTDFDGECDFADQGPLADMVMTWCVLLSLDSSSTAPCVWPAPRRQYTAVCRRRCPWCISARLSPLAWLRRSTCSKLECPCSITLPATCACPASTSARWPMCWGATPSFCASLVLPHTTSRTIQVLDTLPPTRRGTGCQRGNGIRLY